MKQVLLLLSLLVLLMGCATAEDGLPPELAAEPGAGESSQEEITPMPNETLSPELQQTFLQTVGSQQNLSPDGLQITAIEAADWPDACLGLAASDEFCAQIITPGWAIAVTDGDKTWQYRTDLEVVQVRLEAASGS